MSLFSMYDICFYSLTLTQTHIHFPILRSLIRTLLIFTLTLKLLLRNTSHCDSPPFIHWLKTNYLNRKHVYAHVCIEKIGAQICHKYAKTYPNVFFYTRLNLKQKPEYMEKKTLEILLSIYVPKQNENNFSKKECKRVFNLRWEMSHSKKLKNSNY